MARPLDWLPWTPAFLYLIGASFATGTRHEGWTAVTAATRGALGAALIGALLSRPGAAPLVLLLISFLGWIIGDFSRRYLDAEPGRRRYAVAFLATLAAVGAVVAGDNLAVIVGAWAASSVGLHHLLTFYRERGAAVIVAHKKFLASRLAECLLVTAAVLLYRQWGTLDLAAISANARGAGHLPSTAGAAAVLIAAAVLLKCAQLPLHGWLIQVMEAPTPVSALLHAGIVNLGGYVLIRLAPLIQASPSARALLVVVGSLSAALAGLVMLTRVTIKVRLAWSTCSQMGFMMMECGLGLYDLALLHLLAHSLYKAHAFLTAGEAVRDSLARRLAAATPATATPAAATGSAWLRSMIALPAAWIATTGSAYLWHRMLGVPMIPGIAAALLACGLATLLWHPGREPRSPWWTGLPALLVGAQLYLGWHSLLTAQLGVAALPASPPLAAWALLVFVSLYAAQARVATSRHEASATRLYEWIYAGLYLDERFTRFTFRVWPARAPSGGVGGRAGRLPRHLRSEA